MNEGPAWFRPKRYGFGAGLPITWQGWAVTGIYLSVVFGAALIFQDQRLPLLATIIPVTLLFMIVCAKTTQGGWHWRWGRKD